jgi:hypothetical protein
MIVISPVSHDSRFAIRVLELQLTAICDMNEDPRTCSNYRNGGIVGDSEKWVTGGA